MPSDSARAMTTSSGSSRASVLCDECRCRSPLSHAPEGGAELGASLHATTVLIAATQARRRASFLESILLPPLPRSPEGTMAGRTAAIRRHGQGTRPSKARPRLGGNPFDHRNRGERRDDPRQGETGGGVEIPELLLRALPAARR